MIDRIRYTWQLLLVSAILVLAGILIIPRVAPVLPLDHYLSMVGALVLINFTAFMLMNLGVHKKKREGGMILLAGISGKFLLYLLYILLFWLLTKNITKAFILTFFALYLIFTFLMAGHLLNLLKNK